MTSTTRIIVNTLAQHIRTIINICLSLYSTRLVMELLGQSDYGIYMLVAGIVSFLSYFSNAIVVTTQRHLSYSYGQQRDELSKQIFANSYITNCILGLLLVTLLIGAASFLFNGATLNIPSDKYAEAELVYLIVLFSVFLTFITSPFKALHIARENIVYISIIDIIDGILKVALVLGLYLFDSKRLVVYGGIITMIMLFNFIALSLHAQFRYKESCLIPNIKIWDKNIQKQLLSFTTWTIYSSLSIYFRNQSLAIFLNRAYGTFINASFGIATQVLGAISFLSSSVLNAFTPQIIKAEGEGNRMRMLELSLKACKFCYILLAMVAIPIIFEIDSILEFWLGFAPQYASLFCKIFLISSMADQIVCGLNVTNQAQGRIRNYTLLVYTTKLITIPAVWFALHEGVSITAVMVIYLVFEAITAAIRIPYIAVTTGMKISSYVNTVIHPVIVPTIVACIVCWGMTQISDFVFRFIATGLVCLIITMPCIWLLTLNQNEKNYLLRVTLAKLKK